MIVDDERWNLLQHRLFETRIVEAFEIFRTYGIEPILIKGWAAARNYPPGKHRTFADIDIAVSENEYGQAFELTHAAPLNVLNIDIHRELRHLDTTSWTELFRRSRLVPIDNASIRILSPEDHLRVLCTHWLTDGGQYKDRLWDIYYAIENRPQDFDWDICLQTVPGFRRDWVLTTIAIVHKYLQLDLGDLPFVNELMPLPKWVERCLAHEWSNDVRLRSLHTCLNDRKLLLQQIRKRIPPNPIQATIESDAFFDESSRIPMQVNSVFLRIGPSIRRLSSSISAKLWWKSGK